MKLLRYCFSVILLLLSLISYSQTHFFYNDYDADHWVDSVLSSLTLKEKVGQTMMIRSSSEGNEAYYKEIERQIKEYNIGGICFFKGDPVTQAQLTNKWQMLAKTPLLISMDAEWGLEMRLKNNVMGFPKQMTLGAIKDDCIVYDMGRTIAKQLKRIGINMSFSPVADINNNAANPVINYRSFGEDRENVARKSLAYMLGLQENGVIAVAKHFPGHGDTDTDSHHSLPLINHSVQRLDSIELYPFKRLIDNGIIGIMNAHVYVPALEHEENVPSSMSCSIVTDLLRDQLDFKGLTITDGLEMGAILQYKNPGDIEVQSAIAGNDIQLLPIDIDLAIEKTLEAIENGDINEESINSSCRRILYAKYFAGLSERKRINETNIITDLNCAEDKILRRNLYAEAITAIKNEDKVLPLKLDSRIKTACIIISSVNTGDFKDIFLNYHNADFFNLDPKASETKCNELLKNISNYDRVIALVATWSSSLKSYFNISDGVYNFIDTLANQHQSILCIAGNPYIGTKISNIDNYKSVVFAYEPADEVFNLLPQALFGAIAINGQLPVSINEKYKVLSSVYIPVSKVLAYPPDYEITYKYGSFRKVDSIALHGINRGAYPGCQVFAVHKGNVIYNKSFGRQSYDKTSTKVDNKTVYDVASITKIAATTISVMKLQENCIFDVDYRISDFLPFLRGTDKEDIIIREALAHQARLKSYIPFYKNIETNEELRKELLRDKFSEDYPIKVAEKVYLKKDYDLFILDSIANSKLLDSNKCVYSDLGFVLTAKAIENTVLQDLNEYVDENFYMPMGLMSTTFLPLNKIAKERIAPTEDDKTFRRQLIKGYVHDQTAAMLGGVAGNAGLFSTAEELGKIMQMLLFDGRYGNIDYIHKHVIEDFIVTQFPENENRKACGFDKPMLMYKASGPTCKSASNHSFGHTGFTGVYIWADPDNDLIYVFLSNRINPDVSNTKLSSLNIRTNIHQEFYDIIERCKR
ncbi:MAG: serine hydrolase [Bacteroidales bacterium]|nr:serine hydrolase [Bacteroidales bacterium]